MRAKARGIPNESMTWRRPDHHQHPSRSGPGPNRGYLNRRSHPDAPPSSPPPALRTFCNRYKKTTSPRNEIKLANLAPPVWIPFADSAFVRPGLWWFEVWNAMIDGGPRRRRTPAGSGRIPAEARGPPAPDRPAPSRTAGRSGQRPGINTRRSGETSRKRARSGRLWPRRRARESGESRPHRRCPCRLRGAARRCCGPCA